MSMRLGLPALLLAATCGQAPAQEREVQAAVRDWRSVHEGELLAEYFEFLRIPNWARDAWY